MNYSSLRDAIASALEKLEATLQNSITSDSDGFKGSGQLIQEDGKAEHVGIYGTSAIFESIGIEHGSLDSYLAILERLATPEKDHFKQDSEVVFKLCAAINGIKSLRGDVKNEKSEELQKTLVNKLLEISRKNPNGDFWYWPFSKSQKESTNYRKWVLPSAYALSALSGTHATGDELKGVVKFLSKKIEKHLSSEEVLHSHELVHMLLSLHSESKLRGEFISNKEIKKVEYDLYIQFVKNKEYTEKFINFVTFYPSFFSLFYVVKTDLTIIKYLLLAESKYIHSADVLDKVNYLVEKIKKKGSYISGSNDQASVRANALAYRVLQLLSDGLAKSEPRYKTVLGAKWFNQYIRWSPNKKLSIVITRLITLLILLGPIFYIVFSSWKNGTFLNEGITSLASISSSIVAALVYERFRRR